MISSNKLIYNGVKILELSKDELITALTDLYNAYQNNIKQLQKKYESSDKLYCPIGIEPTLEAKKRIKDNRLGFTIFVPAEFDERETEVYILNILDRAKKFRKVAKEKKLDVMPMPEDKDVSDS